VAKPVQIAAYFLLISFTSKGRNQPQADVESEIDKITDLIRVDYSATCELFKVPGPYDFISKVTGVSEAQAIQIQLEIESGGNVKAFLLPGVRARPNK
jgi:uncharacterized protein with GYD domain